MQRLDLGDNAIEHLDKNLLKHNPNLKYLSLSSNKISCLDPEFFSHLKNLKELWLGLNQITFLTSETFEENTKLEILYLNDNEILEIERDTFKNLDELRNLNLVRNECIDRQFGEYPETTTVIYESEDNDYSKKVSEYLVPTIRSYNLTIHHNTYTESTITTSISSHSIFNTENQNHENVFQNFSPALRNCYKNYENFAREVRKLIKTKTPKPICLTNTNKVYIIMFGSICILLLISLLAHIIQCVRKSKSRTTGQEPERQLEMSEPGVPFYTPMNAHSLTAKNSDKPNSGKVYEFGYCADGTVHVYNTVTNTSSEIVVS